MKPEVAGDQWAVMRVQGMHCHRCESSIKKRLSQVAGVHEAEVDFNSSQASVLFDPSLTNLDQLLEAIRDAGYQATAANP